MKYKVGDKVRVKSWDEMVESFGVDENGDIWTTPRFYAEAKEYCGRIMTVAEICTNFYILLEDEDGFDWTDDMLESNCFPLEEDGVRFGKQNNVNHPSHYNDGNIEVIDYIEDKKLGFHLGNAIKYISRAGKKDKAKTREDIEKAIWYLKRYLEVE